MSIISKYASLVKFSHTIFAMPFALISYLYTLVVCGVEFRVKDLFLIVLCMVFARNSAMGFNRWLDRDIDGVNPRTSSREIPAGQISPRSAMIFVVLNSVLFVIAAGFLNRLALYLSPVALFVLLGYSYTKRITSLAHIVLGLALAIVPIGAYVAVTGVIDHNALFPIMLAGLVLTWTGGFDILYSLQDESFDRDNGLHSIPSRFGTKGAIVISIILHLVTVYFVWVVGLVLMGTPIYWVGAALFVGMLAFQHIYFTPSKIERVGAAFGLINGLSSVLYAIFIVLDILF